MTAPLLTTTDATTDVVAPTRRRTAPAPPDRPAHPARSAGVPADLTARLLRCVGEPPVPTIDLTDATTARVPQHVVRGRPLAPTAPLPLPDPTALCCAVVRAAVEVVRGERTVGQLARWVSPEIFETLARRSRLVADGPRPTTTRPVSVRRARVLRIGEGVAEGTVVVEDGDRVRAAAARLEARRGTWRVVALEIG
ncbi:Rv3235 family protein [Cellulosimicrobium cellulans]|uniref:Rv3235 family protein n=1 Tax=Cellulosimicrobium cellulans TaxID=1710 RepID=UPI001EDC4CAE|nr:Rv3235 family protein [Cellulosimicrobium cellulans]